MKDVFSGRAFRSPNTDNETMKENPIEANAGQANETKIAVRSLGMKGKEDSLEHWNKYQSMYTKNVAGDLGKKITTMNDLYQRNAQQVEAYNEFLESIWTMGSTGPNAAQQILKLLIDGVPIKDIAEELFISSKTVENHKASIMVKLKCKNMTELIRYAISIGLIDV